MLPQEVRKVARQCLEIYIYLPICIKPILPVYLSKQDEDDPLVPGVSDLVTLGRHLDQVPVGGAGVGTDPRVGVVQTLPSRQLRGEREGAVDPAEGVEKVAGDAVDVAVDGVAQVLLGCLEEARDQEDGKCVLVVKSECEIIYEATFELEVSSDTFEEG